MKKPIDPSVYDRPYFLDACEGYEVFAEQKGAKLSCRLQNFYNKLALEHQDKVLEIGCGRGELCYAVSKSVKSAIGIDYSQIAIDICKETYCNSPSTNLQFLNADAKKLPFEDNSFDLVYCTEVIEHIHKWELHQMMSEIVRVLNKKGRFVAQTEPNKWWRFTASILSYKERFKQTGIKVSLLIDRPPGHKGVHVNEQTYRSMKKLAKKYFHESSTETCELGDERSTGILKEHPDFLTKFPFLKLLLDKELLINCKLPKK